MTRRAEFGVRRYWRLRRRMCRIGLHFLVWSMQCDGYVCACGQQYLWAEQIRDNDRKDNPRGHH